MERARCMRLHAGFPLQFWVDVVDTTIYLINKGPSSSLYGGIVEEAWTSKKVNYSFLRTSVVKHLSTLIKKIKQSLRKNPRSVPLLDIELMILVITCMIMKTIESSRV